MSVVSVRERRKHEGRGRLGPNTELSATEALPRGKERKKKDWKWSSMVEYLPRVCKALGLDPKQIRCALGLA